MSTQTDKIVETRMSTDYILMNETILKELEESKNEILTASTEYEGCKDKTIEKGIC